MANRSAGDESGLSGGSRKSLRLFVILALISVAIILFLVSMAFEAIFKGHIIESAKSESVAVAEAILAQERGALTRGRADGWDALGIKPEDFPQLNLRMRKYLAAFDVAKIKVYRQKEIIYSTDESIIGKEDAGNARLARALGTGEVDVKVVEKGKLRDLHGRDLIGVDVVETYVPIRIDDEVVGAFEIYFDISTTHARMRTALLQFVGALLIVLILVFGALYLPLRREVRLVEESRARLKTLAATDVLTGLFNRRHLFARIDEEHSRMARLRQRHEPVNNLALIMVDIDHFKAINDARGHQAGDEVLRQVAARIRDALRPYDVAGRYGGEEFLVMLPDTGLDEARIVAERLRAGIADVAFDAAGEKIAITASFGVSASANPGTEVEALVRIADECLYRAKSEGRNRVVSAA